MTDKITDPSHYMMFGDNVIKQIAMTLTKEEWLGACKFCVQKYRLRAGKKGDVLEDVSKANEVERLHKEYEKFCCDYHA